MPHVRGRVSRQNHYAGCEPHFVQRMSQQMQQSRQPLEPNYCSRRPKTRECGRLSGCDRYHCFLVGLDERSCHLLAMRSLPDWVRMSDQPALLHEVKGPPASTTGLESSYTNANHAVPVPSRCWFAGVVSEHGVVVVPVDLRQPITANLPHATSSRQSRCSRLRQRVCVM